MYNCFSLILSVIIICQYCIIIIIIVIVGVTEDQSAGQSSTKPQGWCFNSWFPLIFDHMLKCPQTTY